MPPRHGTRKIPPRKMMGTNGDSPNRSNLTGYDYTGSRRGGAWKNPNGVQVGHSYQEDSTITPMKSTGDTASPLSNAVHIHLYGGNKPFDIQKAAKLRNKKYKGKAGY